MRRIVILLGPPGAGKGTIARSLVEEFGVRWLSSGELLRAEVTSGSPRSQEIAQLIQAGHLVGDELIVALVSTEIEKLPEDQDVLLDGFPRNLVQARALDDFADLADTQISLVIDLIVDPAETERRILLRRGQEQRADDTLQTLRQRMAHFDSQTKPVTAYYRGKDRLQEIDGLGTPQQVLERVRPHVRRVLRPCDGERQKEAS